MTHDVPVTPREDAPATHLQVGWLELFYDLVFVVVIARITYLIHGDPAPRTLLAAALLVVTVWVAWFNVTALVNTSGGLRPKARPFVLASMAGVGIMAVGIDGLPNGQVKLFALGYAAARVAVWPVWALERRARGRSQGRPFLHGPGVAALWIAGSFVPPPWVFGVWIALLLFELALSAIKPAPDAFRFDGGHFVERIGGFVMIVLGESVGQIVAAVGGDRSPMAWVAAAFAFVLLCALWWLVYEATLSRMADVVTAPTNRVMELVGGGQLAVIVGLVGLAAGLAGGIQHADANNDLPGHLPTGALVALCGGLLLVLLGVATLSRHLWEASLGPVATSAIGNAARAAVIALPVVAIWAFGRSWAPGTVIGALAAYAAFGVWRQTSAQAKIDELVDSGVDIAALFARRRGRR